MTRAERIIEARRMIEAGEFDRAVTDVEPYNVHWDQLILECGHRLYWLPKLFTDESPKRRICDECAKAWIEGKS